MAEAVVVGAGVGGLAAAARLAALGHRVTVCEQADVVGGKLGLLERDGFRFDTGPSLLTMPHVFTELFADTGDPLESVLELRRVEPIAHYRFADGSELDAWSDLDTMAAAVEALSPGSGEEWRRFSRRAERIWKASRVAFLETPIAGYRSLVTRRARPGHLFAIAPWKTLRSLARRHLSDPRLVTFVERYATYSGSDPRRAPAALAVIPWAEQAFGAWYVEGGLSRLADALAARAYERGTVIRTGADVAAIEVVGDGVDGVRLADGSWLPADVVVANADADHLYRDLVRSSRADPARRGLRRTTRSLSGFVLLLGVRGRTPDLAHHSVLFPADYDAEFDAVFGDRPRPVSDPTVYVAVPDDPAVAPEGCEAWFVLVNAPRHEPEHGVDWDSPGMADAYADLLLDVLGQRGLPVRDRVLFREVVTPADLERRTRAVGGAIYGTASHGPRAAFLRPANQTPVPGLFLVGGSSHPGGGLPLVALSAKIVADLIGKA